MTKIAVIGGTSLLKSTLFSHLQERKVHTPHGKVIIYTDGEDPELIFLQRHHADADTGVDVYRPPHLINHRANFTALSQFGVDVVVAVCSVGSLNTKLKPGTLVLPDDYFYMFGPTFSFFDDARAHIVPAINATARSAMRSALQRNDLCEFCDCPCVYVQTVGPRFETKAEVRFLVTLGDVVGMTAAHEATCAKELDLPYAIIAMIDNMGHGLSNTELTTEQFQASVAHNQTVVEKAISIALDGLRSTSF